MPMRQSTLPTPPDLAARVVARGYVVVGRTVCADLRLRSLQTRTFSPGAGATTVNPAFGLVRRGFHFFPGLPCRKADC